ncbi:hypothetical protein LZ30DRAFT_145096 [Colletotrichum cereale]|nr:hypothetical protein LZ30DRAFT_145096 [Colletotrichum cereale]
MATSSTDPAGQAVATGDNQILGECREFLENSPKHHPTAADKAALRSLFGSDKVCSPPPGESHYVDDHDTRMDLIPKVHDALKSLNPYADMGEYTQASLWTALWTTPTRDVQNLLDALLDADSSLKVSGQCSNVNGHLPLLVKTFFSGKSPKDDETVYKRDKSQSDSALARDNNQCIVTGAPFPEVCHIFPFSSLARRTKTRGHLVIMETLWGQDRSKRLFHKLTGSYEHGNPNNVCVVDTAKNMISLSPQLHDWWSRGLFAFEPMGEPEAFDAATPTKVTPTRSNLARNAKKVKRTQQWSIRLRFHWLQVTNIGDLKSQVNFSEDPITMLRDWDHECLPQAANLRTWRPVENGQVFTITADDYDKLPDYDILLLQWDLVRMRRLAGGADPAIYSSDASDSEDDLSDRKLVSQNQPRNQTGSRISPRQTQVPREGDDTGNGGDPGNSQTKTDDQKDSA